MVQQWEVQTPSGHCAATGRKLEEGEEFYSVLFEEGETFRRVDVSKDAWSSQPEGAFCSFKSRVPVRQKKRRLLVDNEVLVNFFQRLAGQTEPARIRFRFVLALILMRKRILRYDGAVKDESGEQWRMILSADQSVHGVTNPRLTDDQIESVSRHLGAILHADAGGWAQTDDPFADESGEGSDSQAAGDRDA